MIPGMEQALATFVNESKELLEDMEDGLLHIEEVGDEPDIEAVNSIFRAIHTIKGSAGIFGFNDVVQLTHVTETILDQVRNGDSQFDKTLLSLLFSTRDLIEELIAFASQDVLPEEEVVARLSQLIENLDAYLLTEATDALDITPSQSIETKSESTPEVGSARLWHISFKPKETVFQDGLDPLSFVRYLSNIGKIEYLETNTRALELLDEFDPERCYLAFEISLLTSHGKQDILDVFEFIQSEADISIIPPEEAITEYVQCIRCLPDEKQKLGEMLVKVGAITSSELARALELQDEIKEKKSFIPHLGTVLTEHGNISPEVLQAAVEKQSSKPLPRIHQSKTLRVDAQKLDRLIDQVGEMVITGARTNLLAHETGNEQLIEAMGLLERLVENIRDSSLKLRMVQIGGTFSKFKRVVRDIAEDLGKKVHLEIRGEDTELDKTFVEKISDPLMHIVRNAIDHGIEMPDERIAKGKSETGNVLLNSYHESGSTVIEIRDDGKGIDKEKVREKAISKGLITETMRLSKREIFSLIFEPGFSTAESVTNISGRGVGMDVVRRNIDALRGTVEVDSELDNGSKIVIRLPLTLSIIDGFMFEVYDANYVIPLDMVVECMELHELVDAEQIREKNFLSLRGEVLPFIRLRALFGIREQADHERESLVIVQFGSLRAGLVVDSLKGEFQTVVKPLGRLFEGIKCISGATILGSGDVAVILDVSALIESAIVGYEKAEADKL
ncbi:chemotaxis protein CheA [Vibrio hannami]|uniref:chemotaxis protein CheA n=1 Tax=Vibrio hannami TaxID=2717094 RepID=UPI002410920A|nr:chemotaxis protein CheA [Vibrio hannami]MDG3087917.1 chemotaxis protein CheA [Vibrio hannami]